MRNHKAGRLWSAARSRDRWTFRNRYLQRQRRRAPSAVKYPKLSTRGKLSKRAGMYPAEKLDVSAEEPKIGVFICHCGANIGSIVDVPSVVEYVVDPAQCGPYAQEQLFSCATNSAQEITDMVQ